MFWGIYSLRLKLILIKRCFSVERVKRSEIY